MSTRENIAANIITVLDAVTSPIELKKITREPFDVDELTQQQYPSRLRKISLFNERSRL